MQDLSIKVPAPFAGVTDLGFTVEYPPQVLFAPLRDVPLLLEGPPPPMRRLADRLQLLTEQESAHAWSNPVMLSDEVVVIAFRDRSLKERSLSDGARASLDYVLNLVRPVVFPFLQDCASLAGLRLSERIEMRVQNRNRQVAELELRLEQIVHRNGELLLFG
jgi:hypothetical protein